MGVSLGSMLSVAAKKLNIKTIFIADDMMLQHKIFVMNLYLENIDNKEKIYEFAKKVDVITYEFENIPYETLNEINKLKPVLPKPSVND